MYSWILRFIYSFTYYIHLAIVCELYQFSKYGLKPTFTQEQTFWDRVTEVLQIHYPILIIILCLITANCMVKGAKMLSSFTIQMKTSEPVLLIVAVMVKVKMPGGPAFFVQNRVGLNGKLFKCHKFRTMTVKHNGSTVSVAGDSRITPLGAKLRHRKLDELPGCGMS